MTLSDRLARLDALAQEATPGPWRSDERVGVVAVYAGPQQECLAAPHPRFVHSKNGEWSGSTWVMDSADVADAALIAAADPTTVRALVAVVRAAQEHGICSCRYYPGYPRGDRHAPECDGDPDLRAALSALEALP